MTTNHTQRHQQQHQQRTHLLRSSYGTTFIDSVNAAVRSRRSITHGAPVLY